MSKITVESIVANIEANPDKAIAGLTKFSAAVEATTAKKSKKTIELEVDESAANRLQGMMAGWVKDEHKTIHVDVDRTSMSNMVGAIGADIGKIVTMFEGLGKAGANGLSAMTEGAQGAVEELTKLGEEGTAALTGGGKGGGGGGGLMAAFKGVGAAAGAVFGAIMEVGKVALVAAAVYAVVAALTILTGAIQMVVAAAVAAVATLAPLVGLLGGIAPAVGVGVGAILTLVVGLKNVIGATSAMAAATKKAAGNQYAAVDAAHALANAQRNLADAYVALAQARETAQENLVDQRFGMRQAILSEADAVDALTKAQKHLADIQAGIAGNAAVLTRETDAFTGKVYEVSRRSADASTKGGETAAEAARAVAQAQLNLEEAQQHTLRSREDLNEAEKKGVEGSDIVVAALRRVADAQWALTVAMRKTTTATAALDAAMGKLGPNGKHLANYINDYVVKAFNDLQKATGEAISPGIEQGLKNLMTLMPQITAAMTKWAEAMGGKFAEITKAFIDPKVQKDMKALSDGMLDILVGTKGPNGHKGVLDAILPITKIIVALTKAAMPMMTILTDKMVKGLESLSKWMEQPKNAKLMEQFFTNGLTQLGKWWDVLKPMLGIFHSLMIAAKPLADWMLGSLATDLEAVNKSMKTPAGAAGLKKFFTDMVEPIKNFFGIFSDMFTLMMKIPAGGKTSALNEFLIAMREDLVPALNDFFTMITKNKTMAHDFVNFVSDIVDGLRMLIDFLNSPVFKAVMFTQTHDPSWLLPTGGQKGPLESVAGTGGVADNLWPDKWPWSNDTGAQGTGTGGSNFSKGIGTNGKSYAGSYNTATGLFTASNADDQKWFIKVVVDPRSAAVAAATKAKLTKAQKAVITADAKVAAATKALNGTAKTREALIRAKAEAAKAKADLDRLTRPRIIPVIATLSFGRGLEAYKGKAIDDLLNNPATGRPWGAINPKTGVPWVNKVAWMGGPVKKGEPVLVGENRPELFVPDDNGRIMPSVPQSTGGGISEAQLNRILEQVLAKAKPNNTFDQTFMEKQDAKLLSKEIAWSLR